MLRKALIVAGALTFLACFFPEALALFLCFALLALHSIAWLYK